MLDGGEAMTPDITTLTGWIGRLELGDPAYFLMFSSLLLPQLRHLTITILCQNTQLLECIWVSSRKDLNRHTQHRATLATLEDFLSWITWLLVAVIACPQITTCWTQQPADRSWTTVATTLPSLCAEISWPLGRGSCPMGNILFYHL